MILESNCNCNRLHWHVISPRSGSITPGNLCIQGLLLNEKESLIPNMCGETNCTGYDPNILVSTRK